MTQSGVEPTDALRDLPTPPHVTAALTRHCQEIKAAAADHLACLALYGGIVRGRYRPGESDINVLLVLKEARLERLDHLAPVLRAAWREIELEPWVLALAEIERAAAVFPTKVLDIQRYHRLIAGEDVFCKVTVRQEDLCHRVEQEMSNLAMRLRRRYLSIYDDERALERALFEAALPLRVALLTLLDLAKVEVADDERTAQVFAAAARTFQLEAETLQRLSDLRTTGELAGDVRALFAGIMAVVSKTAELAAQKGGAP